MKCGYGTLESQTPMSWGPYIIVQVDGLAVECCSCTVESILPGTKSAWTITQPMKCVHVILNLLHSTIVLDHKACNQSAT